MLSPVRLEPIVHVRIVSLSPPSLHALMAVVCKTVISFILFFPLYMLLGCLKWKDRLRLILVLLRQTVVSYRPGGTEGGL